MKSMPLDFMHDFLEGMNVFFKLKNDSNILSIKYINMFL